MKKIKTWHLIAICLISFVLMGAADNSHNQALVLVFGVLMVASFVWLLTNVAYGIQQKMIKSAQKTDYKEQKAAEKGASISTVTAKAMSAWQLLFGVVFCGVIVYASYANASANQKPRILLFNSIACLIAILLCWRNRQARANPEYFQARRVMEPMYYFASFIAVSAVIIYDNLHLHDTNPSPFISVLFGFLLGPLLWSLGLKLFWRNRY